MGQCLGIGEIIDCYELQIFPVKTCSKDIPANPTKPINPDPGCHIAPSFLELLKVSIELTLINKISPFPSLPKRGIPPFGKGRVGGILQIWWLLFRNR